MLSLKIKSRIYRYTGLFLADKEQEAYLASDLCQKSIKQLCSYPENGLNESDAREIVIGMWQANVGFYRPMSMLRFKTPLWFFRPLAYVIESFKAIKYDIYG